MNWKIHTRHTTEFLSKDTLKELLEPEGRQWLLGWSPKCSSNQGEPAWLLFHWLEKFKQFDTLKSSTGQKGMEVWLGRLPKHAKKCCLTHQDPHPSSTDGDPDGGGGTWLLRPAVLMSYKRAYHSQLRSWQKKIEELVCKEVINDPRVSKPFRFCTYNSFNSFLSFLDKWLHPSWNVTQLTLGFNLSTGGLPPHPPVFLVPGELPQVNNICEGSYVWCRTAPC